MKKLVVSMNISLDGYFSGPDCELDWHFERWTTDMGYVLEQELSKAGSILMGRKTWQAMAGYWPSKVADPSCSREDISFAVMMNNHHKIVYSNTLETADWNNTTLLKGDVATGVQALKKEEGKKNNIIVYGSGQLVNALVALNLVDEFQLWVHPLVLGKGKRLFNRDMLPVTLKLIGSKTFVSGVILLRYERQLSV